MGQTSSGRSPDLIVLGLMEDFFLHVPNIPKPFCYIYYIYYIYKVIYTYS